MDYQIIILNSGGGLIAAGPWVHQDLPAPGASISVPTDFTQMVVQRIDHDERLIFVRNE